MTSTKPIPEAATYWKLQPEDDHEYKDVLSEATEDLLDKSSDFWVSFHQGNNSLPFYNILPLNLLFSQ